MRALVPQDQSGLALVIRTVGTHKEISLVLLPLQRGMEVTAILAAWAWTAILMLTIMILAKPRTSPVRGFFSQKGRRPKPTPFT
jgi:hypothetical protein